MVTLEVNPLSRKAYAYLQRSGSILLKNSSMPNLSAAISKPKLGTFGGKLAVTVC